MNTLRTTRCTLEPQVEAHAEEMFEVLSDPAIYEFERIRPPSMERLADGYRLRESRVSPDGREKWLNWTVRLLNQEATGYVQATAMESGASYVAYEFASKCWRQGIGSSSVAAMLEELTKTYRVHTFVAVLKSANYRSVGLLNHLGFTPATPEEAAQYGPEQDEIVLLKTVATVVRAPRRFVWNPTLKIADRHRARWACGQAAFEPVHMSTGQQPGG